MAGLPPAGLLCGSEARATGDAARAKCKAPSERKGQKAGEGDEPTKETSSRVPDPGN